MIFKRMLGALGVGGPSVDTVLATPRVRPGGPLRGEVRIKGGDFDTDIQYVALGLVTRVESEYGEGEHVGLMEFLRAEVSGSFRLRAGEDRVIPFELPVPWEAPVTEIHGQRLHGMAMGVRTELAVAGAVDKGDMDPVEIEPLPSQEAVLRAFAQLGFQFKSADLEQGHIYGADQRLPFYQEIEFYPPPAYSGLVNEVELTFVSGPGGMDVVLEADRRGGFHGSGGDSFGRWRVGHDEALHRDWAADINGWLAALSQHGHGGAHGHAAGHGYDGHHDPYAHGGHHDPYAHGGHHGHQGHHGGPGFGAVAAAGAAGLVGGFVAAEIVDEIGDAFEGDDDSDFGGGDWGDD
ncbi:sporulation protein [Streptosporangium sandarakinum]|uniref:sporulation protein n=1 Tax=Streptosporangium sandarakinum TaxID=1260955 RepID=UPI003723B673